MDKYISKINFTRSLIEEYQEILDIYRLLLKIRNNERIMKHISDIENKIRKEEKNEILNKWCKCEFVKADLAKEEDCRSVVKCCIEKFGSIDGLVNAAGITDRGTIEDTTVESWDNIFSINSALVGSFL